MVTLIAIPLRVLWKIKLPRPRRRMILSALASSVVLTFAATSHIVGYLLGISMIGVAGIDFENACSIILLVVVTYAYRVLWCDGEDLDATTSNTDSDDFTQPKTRTARSPMSLRLARP